MGEEILAGLAGQMPPMPQEPPQEPPQESNKDPTSTLTQCRKWFQAAVEHGKKWRHEAKEDYEFVAGKQWTDEEIATFKEECKPVIVINRIKPLLNILSGYQRLNRYEIEFFARTSDDVELCQVRSGVTKYVMDRCDYDAVESHSFIDCAIGGIGWFGTRYKFDEDIQDGEAVIEHVDPFGMYVDPEAHEVDFSDARFLIRAKWVAKDELKQVYPEHADAIEHNYSVYDKAELNYEERPDIEPLYWSSELKKVRVVECWYKERVTHTVFITQDGQELPQEQVTPEMIQMGMIADSRDDSRTEVNLCVFFDQTLLEEMPSPYEHGEFPYIPMIYHHYGVGDLPAGFVRDLKDPQREINKRRIQELHLLNTTANGGGWIEDGAMSPEQESEFKRLNNVPGHFQKVTANALQLGRILEREPKNPPVAVIQAEQQATADLTAISGINENLLGVDIPSQSSGRAIELKQKQAVTHLAVIFDNLRHTKKKIANILWGRRGHKGLIPQYYTAEKTYRIEGENGQQFITVNQQVAQQDPIAGVVVKTLNDLSQGEFDIVIGDVVASATQRQAQMWSLIDAIGKLQIPADLIFDTIIDLSDLPKKNEIKARWQQRQQSQQQQAQQQWQAQLELERVKNADFRMQFAFKDAPLPIQFAMAAKAELIDPRIADYFINVMIQQMAPQLVAQLQQQPAWQMPMPQPPQMQQQAQQMQAQQQQMQQQAQQMQAAEAAQIQQLAQQRAAELTPQEAQIMLQPMPRPVQQKEMTPQQQQALIDASTPGAL